MFRVRFRLLLVAVVYLIALLPTDLFAAPLPAPPTTRTVPVVDTIFGTPVADPYRWLENSEDPQVQTWSTAQYNHFRLYVDGFEDKDRITEELTRFLSTGGIGQPQVINGRYFTERRSGDQNHLVLYVRDGLLGRDEVLIDPNSFAEDGTSAMDWYYLSWDGSLIAYGVSQSGSEHTTLFLKDVSSKGMLLDSIPFTNAAAVAWMPDNSGFFYTRNLAPGTVPAGDEVFYRKIFFHKLGHPWESDPLIFEDTTDKAIWPSCDISPDGRWLGISVFYGWSKSELYLKDLRDPSSSFIKLTEGKDAQYLMTLLNDRFLVSTNDSAPRKRVLSGNYGSPQMANWHQIIPERPVVYSGIAVIGNRIVINGILNAKSVLELFSLEGAEEGKIELPTIGTVSSISGEHDGDELFYYFSSFSKPPTVFRYQFSTKESELFAEMTSPFDLSNLEMKQVWYNSKDGTPVSMFIVTTKGTVLDGNNPCVLDGYGGFNAMDTPVFNRRKILWMYHGGIYALANLRGNGDYGEAWHRAGMLENKQNTFDDFIAAAEYLFKEGYTNPSKLSIYGGSNGGLLIGAVITQRPDICASAVCDVPLLDMIRYHKFRIARVWIPEYGSSEDSTQFEYLLKYSPYHNVKKGTAYPAVLFKAGESDSRVDPLHARKMAAAMQAATSSGKPILLRVEGKAGHGQGKPVSKVAEEVAEEWSFVYRALGLRLP